MPSLLSPSSSDSDLLAVNSTSSSCSRNSSAILGSGQCCTESLRTELTLQSPNWAPILLTPENYHSSSKHSLILYVHSTHVSCAAMRCTGARATRDVMRDVRSCAAIRRSAARFCCIRNCAMILWALHRTSRRKTKSAWAAAASCRTTCLLQCTEASLEQCVWTRLSCSMANLPSLHTCLHKKKLSDSQSLEPQTSAEPLEPRPFSIISIMLASESEASGP